ncbi:hypothetical protein EW146_g5307 [Bondarzewia mesenterica]|uniref:Uncharacterized protein n=1 Tax=Bondarzewia mesenterica TaxID=1095465 RepID=A0A4S4LRV9_9AGAM|nr:hypothetical protein EW146_g5307 [Bondarzewia mesenterica]
MLSPINTQTSSSPSSTPSPQATLLPVQYTTLEELEYLNKAMMEVIRMGTIIYVLSLIFDSHNSDDIKEEMQEHAEQDLVFSKEADKILEILEALEEDGHR